MSDVKKGFPKLTRIDDALKKFFDKVDIKRLPSEDTSTLEALGRVLAEDTVAPFDVPNFDRAAVDGYAVRAEDTYGASSTNPLVLTVVASVEVGILPKVTLSSQQAVRIATGAPLPKGADSIIMVEYTEKISKERIEVYLAVSPGENVSARGEDVKKGEKILLKGTILQPQDIAMLAALGIKEFKVVKRPVVAVFSSGDELIELGDEVEVGRVVDSNRPAIMAMVKGLGAEPLDLGIARDDLEIIKSKLVEALAADMVVASGATSVGEKDFIPEAVNSLGEPGIIVHGISMRPGRPTALAALRGKPIILLPGFPVAAMIAFDVFVKPIVLKMLGAFPEQVSRQTVRARVSRRIPSSLGNRTFLRVIVRQTGGKYVVEPLRTSGSGVISSLVKANGLVVIPENKEGLEEGEEVEVTLLRHIRGET